MFAYKTVPPWCVHGARVVSLRLSLSAHRQADEDRLHTVHAVFDKLKFGGWLFPLRESLCRAPPDISSACDMRDELDRSLREMTRDVARLESGALKLPADGHRCQLIGAAGVEMSAAQDCEFIAASSHNDDIHGGER